MRIKILNFRYLDSRCITCIHFYIFSVFKRIISKESLNPDHVFTIQIVYGIADKKYVMKHSQIHLLKSIKLLLRRGDGPTSLGGLVPDGARLLRRDPIRSLRSGRWWNPIWWIVSEENTSHLSRSRCTASRENNLGRGALACKWARSKVSACSRRTADRLGPNHVRTDNRRDFFRCNAVILYTNSHDRANQHNNTTRIIISY